MLFILDEIKRREERRDQDVKVIKIMEIVKNTRGKKGKRIGIEILKEKDLTE